jgi:hypothetical protein
MIDSTRIVNRLQDYLNGENDVNLEATQIQAAKILLDKSLPSLQSADITAHSSPQIEDQSVLVAKLVALIQSDPSVIKALAPYLSGMQALPAPEQAHTPAAQQDTP